MALVFLAGASGVYTYTRAVTPAPAYAATSSTLNYQARLLHINGNVVPDGYYNIEFKLYDAASSGTELWSESYYDSNGATAGQDNRVRIVNGYMSVNLGSQSAFSNTINWDQELWLTMNVGGSAQTASPTYDGEMSPRIKLTAVPYAFKAGQLAKRTGSDTSTLDFATQTGARTILLPDESGTVCLQSSANCGFAAGSGDADYIQNGTSPQTANFNITGNGTIGGELSVTGDSQFDGYAMFTNGVEIQNQLDVFGSNLFVSGGGNLSIIDDGNLYVSGDATIDGHISITDLTVSGVSLFMNGADSATAFQIQNSSSDSLFTADTLNDQLTVTNLLPRDIGSIEITTSSPVTVDSTVDAGEYVSMAVGADGFARISYYDTTNNDLKFAQCTNADCSTKNLTTVDSGGTVGWYTAVAIGADGFARISYFDDTNDNLKFAQCTNADCSTSVITAIDSTGEVGYDSSIALGADGYARISYYDATNGALKFIQCTNASCSTRNTSNVQTIGDIGEWTSTAIGADGFARISYYDATNGDLKFAQCTNAACSSSTINTVDSTGDVGEYTSMAIGADGFARISYNQGLSGDLKFAQCTNAACSSSTISTVDSTGNVGWYTSLVLDADGFARISYYDDLNGDLKFAQCTNAACSSSTINTVDSTGDVGQYNSMAIGADGFSRIAYFDLTNQALKFINMNDSSLIEGTSIGSETDPFGAIWGSQVNSLSGFTVDGDTGISLSCSSGEVLQDSVIAGGIVVGGSCAASGGSGTLQDAYNASSTPAKITTDSTSKTIIFEAGLGFDTANLFEVEDGSGNSLFNINSEDGGVSIGTDTDFNDQRGQLRLWGEGTDGAGSAIFFGDGDLNDSNGYIAETPGGDGDNDSLSIAGDDGLFFLIGSNNLVFSLGIDGEALFQPRAASPVAFDIQNTSDISLFTVDTTNSRLYVGDSTADATGTLLILDTKNTTGDPTGVNGGMYYSSATGSFRCYRDSAWQSCGPQTKTLTSDSAARTATSYADVTGLTFSVAASTSYRIECEIIYTSASTSTGASFGFNGPASPNTFIGTGRGWVGTYDENEAYFRSYNFIDPFPSVDAANTPQIVHYDATLRNGVNSGTLALRYASSDSGVGVTVKAGSTCSLTQL